MPPLYDVTLRFLNPQTDQVQTEIVTVSAVNDGVAEDIARDHFETTVADFEWYEVDDVVEVGDRPEYE